MFDKMVTEPVPARVFELFRVVCSKKDISRQDLEQALMPDNLYSGSKPNYFAPTLSTAVELGLVRVVDNNVSPILNSKELSTFDDLRRIANLKLNALKDGQFYKVTNTVINLNEEVLKYSQIVDLGKRVSETIGLSVTDTQIRGWRFWAEFLGFGYMQDMCFLPNAYVFLKSILPSIGFKNGEQVSLTEFINQINSYGSVLIENNHNQYLNLAFSNALRQMHREGIIVLKHRNDQEINQQLYPSKLFFNETITDIVYRG